MLIIYIMSNFIYRSKLGCYITGLPITWNNLSKMLEKHNPQIKPILQE